MSISLGFEIRKKISQGQKNFKKMDLKMVYLERVDLSNADLEESDLSYANLKSTNLSYCNLRKACLYRTNLTDANLSGAILKEANFQYACLIGASFKNAKLDEADFRGARLSGTNLHEASWNKIYYDDSTEFASDFDLNLLEPKQASNLESLSEKKIVIEKLLYKLNVIHRQARHYLGTVLAAKYCYSSKPDFDWLTNFEIDVDGEIVFIGELDESLSSIETKLIEKLTDKWIEDFTKNCSQIMPNFSKTFE
ncbi:pentapeptide repeat-containing protein [Candidatus Gracilibacteria bacterium]|nr:pentapeptide repeat-containing protein [Candidatus Gracilibacteria bacterium]NJM86532.1 pentapeptide repeat-containing protein [Hydrococcus sp. RU_2_2]NJP22592.1 pentapeptide repeat-containing protein [Hydrococcus sp. CRU_1_1]